MSDTNGKTVSVVLIGCGCPGRSMGWYHATQILEGRVPGAQLEHVVEPWYMTEAATGTPGHGEFMQWKEELEKSKGIGFFVDASEVPSKAAGQTRMAMICARTADNPKLFAGAVENLGCDALFLEKPGAPTVAELEKMQSLAGSTPVFMGFNKNVSSYLQQAQEVLTNSSDGGKCQLTLVHNNNYPNNEAALAECFERNAEGLLKNMAIHELAILVTFYQVTVDTIASVKANPEESVCCTFKGLSSGKDFTDFTKLQFEVVTKEGTKLIIRADRCGGDDSLAIVNLLKDSSEMELARFAMPDEAAVAQVPILKAKYGNLEVMPYFFTQDPDYCTLKQRIVKHLLQDTPAEGVATLQVAIETLKVAEYLTPILQEQLLSK